MKLYGNICVNMFAAQFKAIDFVICEFSFKWGNLFIIVRSFSLLSIEEIGCRQSLLIFPVLLFMIVEARTQ